MDNSARKVIRQKKKYIKENLLLNDAILDRLEERETLTDEMIQSIKAEKTDHEKIAKLLYILKRRGPTAFVDFVEAIRPDFGFVSEFLESEYNTEQESANNNESDENSSEASNHELPGHSSEESICIDRTEFEVLNTTQTSSIGTQTCGVERSCNSDCMERKMQESHRRCYTKIKSHMISRYLRQPSFSSPEPITFPMIDRLIDELIETIEGCYRTLRVKDNLVTHVIELKESRNKMKKERDEEKVMKDKYAYNRIKLEEAWRKISEKLEEEKRNHQRMQAEWACLKENMEAEMNEKNKQIEELKEQLEKAEKSKSSKANERNFKMHEEEQKVKTERKNFTENAESNDCETVRKELTGPGTLHENKRSRSRDDYQQRRHISYFKSTPRMDKNHWHKSCGDTPKHAKKMQHSNGRQSKELTAVEVPDNINITSTQSFVESHKIQSTFNMKVAQKDRAQNADKENTDDLNGQDGKIHQNEADRSFKQERQILMIGNSSYTSNTLPEHAETSQSKHPNRRISPQRTSPRRKNFEQQKVWIRTNESSQNTAQRGGRNASTERKNLTSLVIVNNSNCSQESPRGAKVMKHH